MRRATKAKRMELAKHGSGSFAKLAENIPSLHRFILGSLVDRARDTREPIVLTHLGTGGAELRCARAHATLAVADEIVIEIRELPEIVVITGFVRAVEPARVKQTCGGRSNTC